jgi:catechol 2,3-dioxygenase-like lactoylglutathione lyase family enzyme
MINHLSLGVREFARSRAFYDAALGALGYRRLKEVDDAIGAAAGYGTERAMFWITRRADTATVSPAAGTHIAFDASTRAAVDAFHRAALSAGGRDNGAPGLRAHYHPSYYAAFVVDPDGHRIEAVSHGAEPSAAPEEPS